MSLFAEFVGHALRAAFAGVETKPGTHSVPYYAWARRMA